MGFAASTATAAGDVATAYLVGRLIDATLQGQYRALGLIGLYAAALVVVSTAARYLATYSSGKITAEVIHQLRIAVVHRVAHATVRGMEEKHSSDICTRLANDAAGVADLIGGLAGHAYKMVFIAGSLAYLTWIDWRILLATATLTPVAVFAASKITRPLKGYSAEYQAAMAGANAIVSETVAGVDVVKAFNAEPVLLARFKDALSKALRLGFLITRQFSLSISLSTLTSDVPRIGCVVYATLLATRGVLTPGELVAYLQLLARLTGPLGELPGMIAQFRYGAGLWDRVSELLGLMQETGGTRPARETAHAHGAPAVELVDVSFGHDGSRMVLEGVSFTVQRGKTVALAGRSGAGKSTLLRLICGFYEPNAGSLRLHGQELRSLDLYSARRQITLVCQEAHLFPGTIAENIELGRPGASLEDIVAAARATGADEFIRRLPLGYDTEVEEGVRLSGGERERLCLARAMLRDAPILLLDEPTASLDLRSEALLADTLRTGAREKAVIIVAHRLSTIRSADEILVLDNGRIVERGTHRDLVRAGALYKRLYGEQLRGSDREAGDGGSR